MKTPRIPRRHQAAVKQAERTGQRKLAEREAAERRAKSVEVRLNKSSNTIITDA